MNDDRGRFRAVFLMAILMSISLLISSCTTGESASSPEEIMANAVKTACRKQPGASPAAGVSTGGSAVAQLCPDVDPGLTLPEEWQAKTPGDLRYVVAVENGKPEYTGHCGPYTFTGKPQFGGGTTVSTAEQFVEISVIDAQTGETGESARVYGPSVNCPAKIDTNTYRLLGGPVLTPDVQKAILEVLSNQVHFPIAWKSERLELGEFAFSPDGKLLASSSKDGTVTLWDSATGQSVRKLERHPLETDSKHLSVVWGIAFSPDGSLLAVGLWDGRIRISDVASGQAVRLLEGHKNIVRTFAFTPDGKFLATGSNDETVKLWDMANGQELRTLTDHSGAIFSLAFSPDAKLLASSSFDKLQLWDAASGQSVRTLEGHPGIVVFSPDGKLLAGGSSDGKVTLWEVASGQVVRIMDRSDEVLGDVISLAFSPDGNLLASGSNANVVRIWEVSSGQIVYTLRPYENGIYGVAFTPEGKLLALELSMDGTVTLREFK